LGCDYDLVRAASSRIDDFVADPPPGIAHARRTKKAAA
jgi:hypothetical protein